ncbi:MAG: flagellar hook basal-body protein, partial [Candidatus Eremiobacteraeota bacterium]|nr:flagellar hook basal-body protein [Candidatus Eremiobacteraeota bacterium]
RAMFAAATGMAAQQTNLETIADNLANAELPAFKASSESFAALTDGTNGLGTVATGKHLIFEQGQLAKAGGPFDVAIDGPGFFTRSGPTAVLRSRVTVNFIARATAPSATPTATRSSASKYRKRRFRSTSKPTGRPTSTPRM